MSKKLDFVDICILSTTNDNCVLMGTKVVRFCAKLESEELPTTTATLATRSLREGCIYLETKALFAPKFQQSCLSPIEEISYY